MFRFTEKRQAIRRAIAEDARRGMRGPALMAKYGMAHGTIIRACRDFGFPLKAGAPRTLPDALPRDCKHCGTTFTPIRKLADQKYCSKRCGGQAFCTPEHNRRVGRENAEKIGNVQRFKGEGKSYVKYMRRHLHRVVAEQMIGRPLRPGEVVHHIDGNRRNNNPSNLQVLKDQREHARVHNFGKTHTRRKTA